MSVGDRGGLLACTRAATLEQVPEGDLATS